MKKVRRLSDDDPRCGPASIQKFAGEDLLALSRQQQQKAEAQQCWEIQAKLKVNESAKQAALEKAEQWKVVPTMADSHFKDIHVLPLLQHASLLDVSLNERLFL